LRRPLPHGACSLPAELAVKWATARTNAGLCLNTGHMTTAGQPGWELLETIPERVFIIGWKDHLTGPDLEKPAMSVELGTGHTDFARYMSALAGDTTERMNLINVEDATIPEKEDALRASLQYLEGIAT